MKEFDNEQKVNINKKEVDTFPVPYSIEEAIENFTSSNNSSSEWSKQHLFSLAINYHSHGKLSEAAEYYREFINMGFSDPVVFTNYGVLLKEKGQLEEAIKIYQKSIDMFPNKPEAYLNLGNILREIGKFQEAEVFTLKAIDLKPDCAMAYSNLGIILNSLGKFEEAKLSHHKAIQLDPKLAEVHCNLGNTLREIGKLKEAEISIRKAIQINPNFADFYSNLGNILKDQGKLEEAELSLNKAIELKPIYLEAKMNLGTILREQGKLEEAEILYRKIIQTKPSFAMAYSNLANVLLDQNQLEEAELLQRKAIGIKPDEALFYSNLGKTLRELGKLKEAEISIRKAIQINPNFLDSYSNLGMILLDLGKLKELNILSKKILSFNSINLGDRLLATLKLAMVNLIDGNFLELSINLDNIKLLIKDGGLNFIKENQNIKYTKTFSEFISSLFPKLCEYKYDSKLEQIIHIGESHCLSFSHQTISLSSQTKFIQPLLITGAKAWHFSNQYNNKWKASLKEQIKNTSSYEEVFISFGEIDCRQDEGILIYVKKYKKDIYETCKKTINGYISYMEKQLSNNFVKRYYFGVPAPIVQGKIKSELHKDRIKLLNIYNSILKQQVISRGCFFLDVYGLTANKEGINNNLYMCDNIHLSPECLTILFENFLYKP